MRILALRGTHVLATGRTQEKIIAACEGMTGTITPLALELTNLDSVNRCTTTIAEMGLNPDTVICNAGIYPFGGMELIDGIEKVFFANFLGHFVLVNNLLPAMQRRGSGRFVHVSSDSAYNQAPAVGIDFDNLCGEGTFNAGEAYGRSKLANALFSLELSHRIKGSGLTSNAIHPGSVRTNISHSASLWTRTSIALLARFFIRTVAEGAATQVYVATSPDVNDVSGRFFRVCNPATITADHSLDDKRMAEELWRVAEEMSHRLLI